MSRSITLNFSLFGAGQSLLSKCSDPCTRFGEYTDVFRLRLLPFPSVIALGLIVMEVRA